MTRRSLIALVLLLGVSAGLNILVALKAYITTDEPHHVEYGARVLHFQPDHYIGVFADRR